MDVRMRLRFGFFLVEADEIFVLAAGVAASRSIGTLTLSSLWWIRTELLLTLSITGAMAFVVVAISVESHSNDVVDAFDAVLKIFSALLVAAAVEATVIAL